MELKFVSIEDMNGLTVAELGVMAGEADQVKAAVQAELKRRADEALETLRAAGYVGAVAVADGDAPKKRGPKPKAAANGIDVAMESTVPAEIQRQ